MNLTLRAAGNLIFNGSLSDGFAGATVTAGLLAPGSLSSSYRLVAGADFTAADFRRVQLFTANAVAGMNIGSLKLGVDGGDNVSNGGLTGTTNQPLAGHFQVIRTGTGDIEIATQGDVQLLNQFATIYTAGAKAAGIDSNIFTIPKPTGTVAGTSQGTPSFQLSFGGGDLVIDAGGDVIHLTQRGGLFVADSEREMPNNWLLRRGYVDSTGFYGTYRTDRNQSTTWWVDYGNFFEGVGALGGGNVTLRAGRDISNVDAVVPTNAYMPFAVQTSPGQYTPIRPAAANLVEFGGGDLTVQAGRNIDAGVYYVENGHGILSAGASITTNATRSPTVYLPLTGPSKIAGEETWLPTTLFLGKGGFDVSAGGDLLLGPVANPFLLPAGIRNGFLDKTYFSTYATSDYVKVTSLAGDIAIRTSAVVPTANSVPGAAGNASADANTAGATSLLASWLLNQLSIQTDGTADSTAFYQPWLRLSEIVHNTETFVTAGSLMPGTLRATAFAGDILLQSPAGPSGTGGIILSPSPTGTIDLLASGSIQGLQPDGEVAVLNAPNLVQWGYARINLSDANPQAIPSIVAPLAYLNITGPGINPECSCLPRRRPRTSPGSTHSSPSRAPPISRSMSGRLCIAPTCSMPRIRTPFISMQAPACRDIRSFRAKLRGSLPDKTSPTSLSTCKTTPPRISRSFLRDAIFCPITRAPPRGSRRIRARISSMPWPRRPRSAISKWEAPAPLKFSQVEISIPARIRATQLLEPALA